MFKPLQFLIVVILLTGSTAFACLNEYQQREIPLDKDKLNLHLLLHSAKDEMPYWWNGFDAVKPLPGRKMLAEKDIAKMNFRERSDYAVAQLKIGDRTKALDNFDRTLPVTPNRI